MSDQQQPDQPTLVEEVSEATPPQGLPLPPPIIVMTLVMDGARQMRISYAQQVTHEEIIDALRTMADSIEAEVAAEAKGSPE